ncbi:MAG: hypothetical protein FJZ94_03865, partial [Chloroflexi bacterium]|nr:hypothetical protein [Chloroflexota bacterium]
MMSKSKRPIHKMLLPGITLVLLASSAVGCAKDETPPHIDDYRIPRWGVENENIDWKVETSDDIETKKVYIEFFNGEKIQLRKEYSNQKIYNNEGEREYALWKASSKLPPGSYSYKIIVKDRNNQVDTIPMKIIIHPKDVDGDGLDYSTEIGYGTNPDKKNPVVIYALNKNPDFYVPRINSLKDFDKDEEMDDNERWLIDNLSDYLFLDGLLKNLSKDGKIDTTEKNFIDLSIDYHPKLSQTVPEIYSEIAKLPDLSTIEEKDLKAGEEIFVLATNPKYKEAFELILNEGIKDRRKYCTPLEALLWIAYDKDFEMKNNPLEIYSSKNIVNSLVYDA